jgi:hypothetical protein
MAQFGAVPQGVSVMRGVGHDDIQYGVALKWPAEEPYLDKPMGADVTTCAFCGDFRGVPIRVRPPEDDDLCSVFAVAEERFQRKYRLKDLLDMAALAAVLETRFGDDLIDLVPGMAAPLCLAPELVKLLTQVDDWLPLSPLWTKVTDALRPVAQAEKELRRGGRPGMHELFFGMPLDDVGAPGDRARLIARDGGDILVTPIGTCLLVNSPVLEAEALEDAVAFARTLR